MPRFVCCGVDHELFEGLHHSELLIISTQGKSQLLAFPVVIEQLFVLVAYMIDHFFILLRAVGKDLQSLGRRHCPSHKLRPCPLLQSVLLITEEELPFVEAVREICLLMLLSIGHEVEPVPNDPAHGYEASPPVKALRLQVIVGAIPALPSTNRLCKKLARLL